MMSFGKVVQEHILADLQKNGEKTPLAWLCSNENFCLPFPFCGF
jgi:hypothetical protein